MEKLFEKKCKPCEGGVPPLEKQAIQLMLKEISGWTFDEKKQEIVGRFEFKNFYQTMAFANAVAWIANQEDHHPDLELGFKQCVVHYKTHAINGLSENDFICAAKINLL